MLPLLNNSWILLPSTTLRFSTVKGTQKKSGSFLGRFQSDERGDKVDDEDVIWVIL